MKGVGIRPTVRPKAQRFFLSSEKIRRGMDNARDRALRKSAAYVFRVMRNSIRSTKTPARPGQPPRSRTGRLKKSIRFAQDRSRNSQVIGPVKYGRTGAPGLMEHGGTTNRGVRFIPAKQIRRGSPLATAAEQSDFVQVKGPFRYKRHPFAKPALDEAVARGKVPEPFRGAFRR